MGEKDVLCEQRLIARNPPLATTTNQPLQSDYNLFDKTHTAVINARHNHQ